MSTIIAALFWMFRGLSELEKSVVAPERRAPRAELPVARVVRRRWFGMLVLLALTACREPDMEAVLSAYNPPIRCERRLVYALHGRNEFLCHIGRLGCPYACVVVPENPRTQHGVFCRSVDEGSDW